MSKFIIYTGPTDQVLVPIRRLGFQKIFTAWSEPVLVSDDVAKELLKMPGFVESGFDLKTTLTSSPGDKVAISRIAALGDLIQLVAVMWEYPLRDQLLLRTQKRFHPFLKHIYPELNFDFDPSPASFMLNFDGLIERDSKPPYSEMHRMDIYRQAMRSSIEVQPGFFQQEFNCDTIKGRNAPLDYIIFAPVGTREGNSIVDFAPTIRAISKKINVLVLQSPAGKLQGGKGISILNDCNLIELLSFFHKAKAVVTTDTGSLWLAHLTKNPLVALLGPTTEKQRLSYYPGKYRAVDLKSFVGCPKACHDKLDWCQGKITCLRTSDPALEFSNKLTNKVMESLHELSVL